MSQRELKATPEDLAKGRIALAWRDSCADFLLDLNKCRQATYYMPWKCEHERHAYEKCQYEEFVTRLKDPSSHKHH